MNTNPENTIPVKRPFTSRLLGRLFSWRTLRRLLIALASLVTLIALFCTEENWRGKRAWEAYKAEWEAKGEKFDLDSFLPKPVPPEQNFCAIPALAGQTEAESEFVSASGISAKTNMAATNSARENWWMVAPGQGRSLGDWEHAQPINLSAWQAYYRQNTNFLTVPNNLDPAHAVLMALSKFDPVVNELREASSRPYAQAPFRYGMNMEKLIPYFVKFRNIGMLLRLRALASLEAGETAQALQDIALTFRLVNALDSEPLLIDHSIRIAMTYVSLQPIWEGLAKHRWTEPQLEELQHLVQSVDLLSGYTKTMRGERAFSIEMQERFRHGQFSAIKKSVAESGVKTSTETGVKSAMLLAEFAPGGWLYQNELASARLHQEVSLRIINVQQHRIYPDLCGENFTPRSLQSRTPYNVFAQLMLPAIRTAALKTARAQSGLDRALIACALERYRIAQGQYPAQLDALAPRFLAKLPPDVINGQPLKYRLTGDGQFVLYSVGLDQKDDGGAFIKPAKNGSEQGDWVWRYPANKLGSSLKIQK